MAPQVQVPALELEARYENKAVEGAKVVVTDTQCPEVGNKLKRTFLTDKVGHAAVSKLAVTLGIGLPYGIYNVCVSAKFGTQYRRATLTELKVQDPSAPTIQSVTLTGNSSTTECT
jgi:hypothetical protein